MRPADQMITRFMAEIENRQTFLDGLVETAEKEGRDLSSEELDLIKRARDDIQKKETQVGPLLDAQRIAVESRSRLSEVARVITDRQEDKPRDVEYRSAGAYVLDMWRAHRGDDGAHSRLEIYHRAAAHQTTADNAGILPEPVVGPVLNFIDAARPLVSALGPRDMPGATWKRPKVTQHTEVKEQGDPTPPGEKEELASQKMLITSVDGTARTWGGYVNISRQNLDFTAPNILDIVIQDLAAIYAQKTENDAADVFLAGSTAATTNLGTGTNTAEQVAAAVWGAVGQVYAGTKGQGRVIAAIPPQMLGLVGPLFAPVNPVDSQSTGFSAVNFGQGAQGQIGGVPFYVTAGLADNKILVLSTAAAEVYEQRIGALQVVEPSVLGLQVAYAGYFTPLIVQATGIIAITKTP